LENLLQVLYPERNRTVEQLFSRYGELLKNSDKIDREPDCIIVDSEREPNYDGNHSSTLPLSCSIPTILKKKKPIKFKYDTDLKEENETIINERKKMESHLSQNLDPISLLTVLRKIKPENPPKKILGDDEDDEIFPINEHIYNSNKQDKVHLVPNNYGLTSQPFPLDKIPVNNEQKHTMPISIDRKTRPRNINQPYQMPTMNRMPNYMRTNKMPVNMMRSIPVPMPRNNLMMNPNMRYSNNPMVSPRMTINQSKMTVNIPRNMDKKNPNTAPPNPYSGTTPTHRIPPPYTQMPTRFLNRSFRSNYLDNSFRRQPTRTNPFPTRVPMNNLPTYRRINN